MQFIAKFIESPYTALAVAIVLGALALSGQFNVTLTQLLLGAAWAVAFVGLRDQPWPIMVGASAMIAGCLLMLGYWFRPETVSIDLSKNEGILVPDNQPIPDFAQNSRAPANAIMVVWGTNVSWTTQPDHVLLEMASDPMIAVKRDQKTGNLVVTSLKVFDDRNDRIARIDEDGFWVQNNTFKKRPNEHTLVVYDHNDDEVLRIEFINPRVISVTGIFRHPKMQRYFEITKDAAIEMPNHNSFSHSQFGNVRTSIAIPLGGGFIAGRN